MESFLSSLFTLDTLIHSLERRMMAPHRKSPFEKLLKDNGMPIQRIRELPVPPKRKEAPVSRKIEFPSSNASMKSDKKVHVLKKSSPQEVSLASSSKSSVQGFEGMKKGFGKPAPAQSQRLHPKPKPKPEAEAEEGEKEMEDFLKCDLRVGLFKRVWRHPDSDYLYCEEIDIKREVREIASGLQHDIPIEGMAGKTIVFANLKVKKLGGFPSNGMVLCSNLNQSLFELLRPHDSAEPGDRVYLDGGEELPDEPEKQIQSKVRERVLKHFKTDAQGYPTYLGKRLRTKAGLLKPSKNVNGNID